MKSQPRPEDLVLARRSAEEIRKLYPDAEVILYGSRARGNPDEDSDLDLLVLTQQQLDWREQSAILSCIYPIELASGVVIVPIVENHGLWYTAKYQVMPLAKAIKSEGISL